MKKIILTVFLITISLAAQPPILVNSSHNHNSVQFAFSFASNTVFDLHSRTIARNIDSKMDVQNWIQINTKTNPATITPPLQDQFIILNTEDQGRHILHYYEKVRSTDQKRHFYYLGVKHDQESYGYLLPLFSQIAPGVRTDRLFRCSNTLISVEWIDSSAHIVIFSQHDTWRITESIDGGFRSDERGLFYGYAIDYGHVHPVKIDIGNHEYCVISKDSKPAHTLDYNWSIRQNYRLGDVLQIIKQATLPLHDNRKQRGEQL